MLSTSHSILSNISTVDVVVAPTFENLAWNVDSVTATREVVVQWEVYPFTFGMYTISLTRYSDHYVTTTILPGLIITSIVLCGLWMNEHGSRLSLSVTGLLTMIAIQVYDIYVYTYVYIYVFIIYT